MTKPREGRKAGLSKWQSRGPAAYPLTARRMANICGGNNQKAPYWQPIFESSLSVPRTHVCEPPTIRGHDSPWAFIGDCSWGGGGQQHGLPGGNDGAARQSRLRGPTTRRARVLGERQGLLEPGMGRRLAAPPTMWCPSADEMRLSQGHGHAGCRANIGRLTPCLRPHQRINPCAFPNSNSAPWPWPLRSLCPSSPKEQRGPLARPPDQRVQQVPPWTPPSGVTTIEVLTGAGLDS